MRSKQTKKLPVEPISHEPLHERLHASLRQAIMAGQFMPGQQLTVRGVAEAFGTSPMPVRASLKRLVSEGGLEQQLNGTVIVPRLDKRTFSEIMELRAILEERATFKAAPNISKRTLNRLRTADAKLAKASEGEDIIAYLEENRRLKFSIYEHCETPVLLSVIEGLWLKAGPILRHLSADLKGIMQINYHRDALDAIERGDAQAAAEAISKDILAGMDYILETTEDWR